jgi:general secretion pathway protein N
MNWLENNPLGVAMVSFCGLALLVSGAMIYVWSKPATSGASPDEMIAPVQGQISQMSSDLGPITGYKEVTERPVFDESRRPSLSIDGEGLDMDNMSAIDGAPEVRLTGVIITATQKLAMLRPVEGGESLVAREGESLESDYAGWSVSEIKPRSVMLESRDGDELELDLLVNTRKIEEPISLVPEVAANSVEAQSGAGGNGRNASGHNSPGHNNSAANGEGENAEGQPLSRAEEIRQRIAARREELRRQAQDTRGRSTADSSDDSGGSNRSSYQSAIQDMVNRNARRNEEENNGDNDGDGGDG